ncbi:glutathione S-transferase family protein [Parvibaculum sedimenti]|nr:glutathione S-transferase family protein [Parvibaculum sedimenti]
MAEQETSYTMIGAELSLYSGKVRSYLLQKRIPFVETHTTPWELFRTAPKRTKASAVPIMITPEDEWLQDSSVIIDELEKRFPACPVLPVTPVLRFASYLFELWGDEFWLPLAMHARWSHDENRALFVHDAGEALMRGYPMWLRNLLGNNHARLMRRLARSVGVTPEGAPVIDRFAQVQLDGLNRHFEHHAFLFGDRPSLGDYGLIGPLYAHLGRDPWPKRELIAPRPHLKAWIERMFQPSEAPGAFDADDRVAATLMPALRSIFDEMVPFVAACAAELRKTRPLASGGKIVRHMSPVSYPMAGGAHRRPALSYPVWMAQRMLDAFGAMSTTDQQRVREWLATVGGEEVLQLDLPHVERVGLAAVLAG